jgi:hypothetical protein
VELNGTADVQPEETTTYNLTAIGSEGTATASAVITVYGHELDSDDDGVPDWYEIQTYQSLEENELVDDCDCPDFGYGEYEDEVFDCSCGGYGGSPS